MKLDDVVKLTGISRHGKNRVGENGELAKIIQVTASRFCVSHLDYPKSWRWIQFENDLDYGYTLHHSPHPNIV